VWIVANLTTTSIKLLIKGQTLRNLMAMKTIFRQMTTANDAAFAGRYGNYLL
jgi:hypothetical protein